MRKETPPITLYVGNVDVSVIQDLLNEKYASLPVSLEVKPEEKEGRGLSDIINFVYQDPIAASLVAAVLWDITKTMFVNLNLCIPSKLNGLQAN